MSCTNHVSLIISVTVAYLSITTFTSLFYVLMVGTCLYILCITLLYGLVHPVKNTTLVLGFPLPACYAVIWDKPYKPLWSNICPPLVESLALSSMYCLYFLTCFLFHRAWFDLICIRNVVVILQCAITI